MDDAVSDLVNRKDAPAGLYTEKEPYRIWVKR
jgi:hypothetical protein